MAPDNTTSTTVVATSEEIIAHWMWQRLSPCWWSVRKGHTDMLLASTNVLTRYLCIKYCKCKNTREAKQWAYASAARTFTLCKQWIESILWFAYENQRLGFGTIRWMNNQKMIQTDHNHKQQRGTFTMSVSPELSPLWQVLTTIIGHNRWWWLLPTADCLSGWRRPNLW